jgi:ethanolamine ammonia-lyase small subunit
MEREYQVQVFAEMASNTPARIGVGRTGTRSLTEEMLKLRLDHADDCWSLKC